MVIKPKIRGFICTNAHPVGCAEHVKEQIEYVKSQTQAATKPKNVLVIGASTGYGLASRITAAFGCGAKTLGIFFEKEPTEKKTATTLFIGLNNYFNVKTAVCLKMHVFRKGLRH